jgi:Putative addiction module component
MGILATPVLGDFVARVTGLAERARLVTDLLATLEPDVPSQGHSESEWIAKVERRAWAARAGEVGLTWSEARSEIQQRLPDR